MLHVSRIRVKTPHSFVLQITLVVLKFHIRLNFNNILFKGTFFKGHVHFFEPQQKKNWNF